MIVAIGITTAMAAIMINIVVNLLSTAQRAGGSLLASNQAKVALDFIAQDLQSAVMRPDRNVWLAATIQPDQSDPGDCECDWARWSTGTVKPGNASESLELTPGEEGLAPEQRKLEDFRFGMAGVWLRLFTVEPDRNDSEPQYSTIRAVGYQIVRHRVGETNASSFRYSLFRCWVRPFGSPDSTFEEGYSLFRKPTATPGVYTQALYNVAEAGNAGNVGTIRKPRTDLILANNVIDFGVRFRRRDDDANESVMFPVGDNNLGFAATTTPGAASEPNAVPPNPASGAPTFDQMTYGFPDVAEIFLRVLTDEGAKILEAYERNPIPGTTWWDVAIANSQVFTRRVEMKGKAL